MCDSVSRKLVSEGLWRTLKAKKEVTSLDFLNDYEAINELIKKNVINGIDRAKYGTTIENCFQDSLKCSKCSLTKSILKSCSECDTMESFCKSCYKESIHKYHEYNDNYAIEKKTLELYFKKILLSALDIVKEDKPVIEMDELCVLYLRYTRKAMDCSAFEIAVNLLYRDYKYDSERAISNIKMSKYSYLCTAIKLKCDNYKAQLEELFLNLGITDPTLEICTEGEFMELLFFQSFFKICGENFTNGINYQTFGKVLFLSANAHNKTGKPNESIYVRMLNSCIDKSKALRDFMKIATKSLLFRYNVEVSTHLRLWLNSSDSLFGENFKIALFFMKIIIKGAMVSKDHLNFFLQNKLLVDVICFAIPLKDENIPCSVIYKKYERLNQPLRLFEFKEINLFNNHSEFLIQMMDRFVKVIQSIGINIQLTIFPVKGKNGPINFSRRLNSRVNVYRMYKFFVEIIPSFSWFYDKYFHPFIELVEEKQIYIQSDYVIDELSTGFLEFYQCRRNYTFDSFPFKFIIGVILRHCINEQSECFQKLQKNATNSRNIYFPSLLTIGLRAHLIMSHNLKIFDNNFLNEFLRNNENLLDMLIDIKTIQFGIVMLEGKEVMNNLVGAMFFNKKNLVNMGDSINLEKKESCDILMFFYSLVFLLYADRNFFLQNSDKSFKLIQCISFYMATQVAFHFYRPTSLYYMLKQSLSKLPFNITKEETKLFLEKLKNTPFINGYPCNIQHQLYRAIKIGMIPTTNIAQVDDLFMFHCGEINAQSEINSLISKELRCSLLNFILSSSLSEAMCYHITEILKQPLRGSELLEMIIIIISQIIKDYNVVIDNLDLKGRVIAFFNTKYGSCGTLFTLMIEIKNKGRLSDMTEIMEYCIKPFLGILQSEESPPDEIFDINSLKTGNLLAQLQRIREKSMQNTIKNVNNAEKIEPVIKQKVCFIDKDGITFSSTFKGTKAVCYICHGDIVKQQFQGASDNFSYTFGNFFYSNSVAGGEFKTSLKEDMVANQCIANSLKLCLYTQSSFNYDGLFSGGCGHSVHSDCLQNRCPTAAWPGSNYGNHSGFDTCDICFSKPNTLIYYQSNCLLTPSFEKIVTNKTFYDFHIFYEYIGQLKDLVKHQNMTTVGDSLSHWPRADYSFPSGFSNIAASGLIASRTIAFAHDDDIILSLAFSIQSVEIETRSEELSIYCTDLSETQRFFVLKCFTRAVFSSYRYPQRSKTLCSILGSSLVIFEHLEERFKVNQVKNFSLVDHFKLFLYTIFNMYRTFECTSKEIYSRRKLIDVFGSIDAFAICYIYMSMCLQNIMVIKNILLDKKNYAKHLTIPASMLPLMDQFCTIYQKLSGSFLKNNDKFLAFQMFIKLQIPVLRCIALFYRFMSNFEGIKGKGKYDIFKEYRRLCDCLKLPRNLQRLFGISDGVPIDELLGCYVNNFKNIRLQPNDHSYIFRICFGYLPFKLNVFSNFRLLEDFFKKFNKGNANGLCLICGKILQNTAFAAMKLGFPFDKFSTRRANPDTSFSFHASKCTKGICMIFNLSTYCVDVYNKSLVNSIKIYEGSNVNNALELQKEIFDQTLLKWRRNMLTERLVSVRAAQFY